MKITECPDCFRPVGFNTVGPDGEGLCTRRYYPDDRGAWAACLKHTADRAVRAEAEARRLRAENEALRAEAALGSTR